MRDKKVLLTNYLQARTQGTYGLPLFWGQYRLPNPMVFTPADVDELARYLLQDAEFQAIRLGTWLGTPQGELISSVVNQALPPTYRPYARLFEEALTRAAKLQREGRKQEAKPLLALAGAIVFIVGAAVLGGRG
jgi:hypothetical protein